MIKSKTFSGMNKFHDVLVEELTEFINEHQIKKDDIISIVAGGDILNSVSIFYEE